MLARSQARMSMERMAGWMLRWSWFVAAPSCSRTTSRHTSSSRTSRWLQQQRTLQAAMVLGKIGVLDTTQVHQPSPPSQPFIVES
jgi:hypothetical protein